MKIRPVGAGCCLRTNRRTEITKLTAASYNFAKLPKRRKISLEHIC